MLRPCFLVVDRESFSAISTRKLIIETANFNVITAYSSQEAIDTLEKYPNIDGIVADSGLPDMLCEDLIDAFKTIAPQTPVIIVCTPRGTPCDRADHTLQTFDPKELLALLERLHPKAAKEIEKHNEDLEDMQSPRGSLQTGTT